MKAAQKFLDTNNDASRALARIDTQDEAFTVPLAEYLTTHGCTVIVNSHSTENSDYHLVVGDWQFVNRILVQQDGYSSKRIGIVWGERGAIDEYAIHAVDAKLIFVEETTLSSRLITDIFQFFFTGSGKTRDFRHQGHVRPNQSQVVVKDDSIVTPLRDLDKREKLSIPKYFAEDKQRIAILIEDLFSHSNTSKRSLHKPISNRFIKRLFFGIFLCLLPMLWYFGIVGVSFFIQWQTYNAIAGNRADSAGMWYHIVKPLTDAAVKTHALYKTPFYWLGLYRQIKPYDSAIEVLSAALSLEASMLTSIDEGHALGIGIMGQEDFFASPAPAAALSRLKNELSFLIGQLGLVQAILDTLSRETHAPFSWSKLLWNTASIKSAQARGYATMLSHGLEVYGVLGGFRQKQTYLLLFQNSMELRPTGGFIGSIGTAVFAEGKLTDFTIGDVYTIDGQLKGHVNPPEPIASLLGSEHWYLRDSNWDPDFRESARRALWFYEKETGTSVDGVIAISVPLIVELLHATGPIPLVDIHDTITADNFFVKSLYYTQQNFFPGSTQKKDFLGALARAIFIKLQSTDSTSPLAGAILAALGNRTLMFYSNDASDQDMIEQYGWSGRIPERVGCKGLSPENGECIPGFLAVIEANLGVNKANYFLKRRITEHITLDKDGSVRETIIVEYTNNSSNLTEGGGPYLSYARFLISPQSRVEHIQVDGQDVPLRDSGGALVLPPYQDRVTQTDAFTIVPVALWVPPGTTKSVSIVIARDEQFGDGINPLIFQHVVQKQPGTSDDPLRISITYPLHWSLDKQILGAHSNIVGVIAGGKNSVTPIGEFLAKEGRVEYNTTLSTDQTATFLFLR